MSAIVFISEPKFPHKPYFLTSCRHSSQDLGLFYSTHMTYAEKLSLPEWKDKRSAILSKRGNTCEECGKKTNLQLHHCWYESNREPWDYPDECFMVLCGDCHEGWHETKLNVDQNLSGITSDELTQLWIFLKNIRESGSFEFLESINNVFFGVWGQGFKSGQDDAEKKHAENE